MIILNAYPPNYEAIKTHFPAVEDNKYVIFTHGQVIYNPYNQYIDIPLQFHEATHSIQQDKLGAEKWWDKYLIDTEFRINQEAEAYHNQFNKFKKTEKDRNKHTQYLHELATYLASDIYGKGIAYTDALKEIKKYGKTN